MTTVDQSYDHIRDWVPDTRDLLIDGQMVAPEGETWDVLNPATEGVIAHVGGASLDQVDAAVGAECGEVAVGCVLFTAREGEWVRRAPDDGGDEERAPARLWVARALSIHVP